MSNLTQLTTKQVEHIAQLARLKLTSDETKQFQAELSQVLSMAEKLESVQTDQLAATAQVTNLENVYRQDEVGVTLSLKEVLANAPGENKRHFEVPSVL